MTRRQWLVIGVGAVAVLIGGFAIGFAVSSGEPTPSPTPTATPGPTCQVSVTPTTIRVDPVSGSSDDVLFFAGSGFPATSAVQIDFAPVAEVRDLQTTAEGTFETSVAASPDVTYPADVVAGPLTWTVRGWDGPTPSSSASPSEDPVCTEEVTVTVELTQPVSPTPPTDLSAGGYAEILADGVRVRVEPSLEATVVGALFTGDVVRILEPAQVVEGLAWYRIESVVTQSGDQVSGYIAAGSGGQSFLRPTGEPPPPTPSPSPSASPSGSPT